MRAHAPGHLQQGVAGSTRAVSARAGARSTASAEEEDDRHAGGEAPADAPNSHHRVV